MSEIVKWKILQNIKQDFIANISSAYIFGKTGKQVIIISKDDNVFAFGDNSNGCIGLEHISPIEPTRIEELCQKQVIHIEFSANYDFVLALTQNGTVYYWGSMSFKEDGDSPRIVIKLKPEIYSSLSDKKVIDIKTGLYHCLALTASGESFIWGNPYLGMEPRKTNLMSNQKIISIDSGLEHALAITDSGDVFWGNIDQITWLYWPRSYYVKKVNKLCCGPKHSLLLSSEGIIYCFGNNLYGQCGNGTNDDCDKPTKIKTDAKFIDIAASKHYSISVALSDNGSCYIWGKCGPHSLNKPIAIPNNNMIELIEYYSSNKVSYRQS